MIGPIGMIFIPSVGGISPCGGKKGGNEPKDPPSRFREESARRFFRSGRTPDYLIALLYYDNGEDFEADDGQAEAAVAPGPFEAAGPVSRS